MLYILHYNIIHIYIYKFSNIFYLTICFTKKFCSTKNLIHFFMNLSF